MGALGEYHHDVVAAPTAALLPRATMLSEVIEVIEEDSDGIEEESEDDEQEQPQPQPQQMLPAPMAVEDEEAEEMLKEILEQELEEQDRARRSWW